MPMGAVNVGAIVTVFQTLLIRGWYKLYTKRSVSSRVLALIMRASIEGRNVTPPC
jgi:hypothetical protein